MSLDRDDDPDPADDAFIAAFERSIDAARAAVTFGAHPLDLVVPRIDLDEEIHATARTMVYRGRTIGDAPTPVAVKVLRHSRRFPAGRVRLEREAALLATLSHPGIASLVAYGDACNGEPYLATAYVEGMALYACRQAQTLTVRERVELARDLADALAYAHQRGVLHRDVSPANVIVRATPSSSRICLLDFELARRGEDAAAPADERRDAGAPVTVEGAPFGTIGYMAPEQLAGHWSDVDVRSDVFAVGTILYELLADRLPWDVRDRSCAEAIDIMRRGPAPSIASLARDARGDLAVIVDKAIDRDPEARYPTMAALSDDLDRWLRAEPILARRPSPLQLARLAIRRRPRTAVAVTLIVALSGACLASYIDSRQNKVAALEEASRNAVDIALEAQNLIGPLPLRRRLLASASDVTARLVAVAPNDPESLRLRASALRAESVLAFEERAFDRALSSRMEALAIAESLVAASHATAEDRRALAISHVLIGDIGRERRDWHAAGAAYARADSIFRALLDADPTNESLVRQVACGYERRVSINDVLGAEAEAERLVHEGIAFIDRTLEERPEFVQLRYERLTLLLLAERFAVRANDVETQARYARAGADDARAIVEFAPGNCDYRRVRAAVEVSLATSASNAGETDDAREHLRTAIADLEFLVTVDASRPDRLGPLCHAYVLLIEIEHACGNIRARDIALRRAMDLVAVLKADASRNPDLGSTGDFVLSTMMAVNRVAALAESDE